MLGRRADGEIDCYFRAQAIEKLTTRIRRGNGRIRMPDDVDAMDARLSSGIRTRDHLFPCGGTLSLKRPSAERPSWEDLLGAVINVFHIRTVSGVLYNLP